MRGRLFEHPRPVRRYFDEGTILRLKSHALMLVTAPTRASKATLKNADRFW